MGHCPAPRAPTRTPEAAWRGQHAAASHPRLAGQRCAISAGAGRRHLHASLLPAAACAACRSCPVRSTAGPGACSVPWRSWPVLPDRGVEDLLVGADQLLLVAGLDGELDAGQVGAWVRRRLSEGVCRSRCGRAMRGAGRSVPAQGIRCGNALRCRDVTRTTPWRSLPLGARIRSTSPRTGSYATQRRKYRR
jgi:hypothetical protein